MNFALNRARTERQSLIELRIVALLILLWGALSLYLDFRDGDFVLSPGAADATGFPRRSAGFDTNNFDLNFDASGYAVLVFVILWLRFRIGRFVAIFFSGFWLIGAVVLALELFPFHGFSVAGGGHHLDNVPKSLLKFAVFPFLLCQIWQLYVLTRADVRAVFHPRPKPAPLPALSSGPFK